MKIANIVLPFIGILMGLCGVFLLENMYGKHSKFKMVIAILLITIGFIAIIGAGVIEKYMWWTSWGW